MANVTLINLNRIKTPAIGPIGIEYLANALIQNKHEVEVLDLTPVNDPKGVIEKYFSRSKPELVGLSLRNTFDIYFPSFLDLDNQGSFLPTHKYLVDIIKEFVPNSNIILGGVGFSSNPKGVLDRLGLKYGVRGPGEIKLVEVANRISRNGRISDLEQEIFDGRHGQIVDDVKRGFIDNPWYYLNGGMGNLRTNNGCPMLCSYCVEPYAKGNRFSTRNPESVIKELSQLVKMGVKDIHSADSEFNLPFSHSKLILQSIANAIKDGRLDTDFKLWLYCTAKPFDDEYADLLLQANVAGVNIAPEHFDSKVLKSMNKWYSAQDVFETTRLLKERNIKVMQELLFGYVGDTPEKMYEAIDKGLNSDPEVLGVSLGIGVLPESYLSKQNLNQAGYYHTGIPLLDPTFYVDPSFKIPEIFDELNERYSSEIYRTMLPSLQSTDETNNQLVDSSRVKRQLSEGRMGPSWAHYREMMRKN